MRRQDVRFDIGLHFFWVFNPVFFFIFYRIFKNQKQFIYFSFILMHRLTEIVKWKTDCHKVVEQRGTSVSTALKKKKNCMNDSITYAMAKRERVSDTISKTVISYLIKIFSFDKNG